VPVRLAAKVDLANDESVHQRQERYMTKITYEVVEHDGGWAYRVDGVFSETFPSHDMARRAAERVAKEQVVPGDTTGISYEDKDGRWHDEVSPGDDRRESLRRHRRSGQSELTQDS
jgi:Uncharacterized protein conserved in bacteria (DUF2188)